ncbi:hypothetical protein [Paenibacillus sp. sgz500958]|uniref:hypothetical protein n=1 Tax=Paenibacillus sp. sgz500958 TaxID=3242475 RepID=UPI0036D22F94
MEKIRNDITVKEQKFQFIKEGKKAKKVRKSTIIVLLKQISELHKNDACDSMR